MISINGMQASRGLVEYGLRRSVARVTLQTLPLNTYTSQADSDVITYSYKPMSREQNRVFSITSSTSCYYLATLYAPSLSISLSGPHKVCMQAGEDLEEEDEEDKEEDEERTIAGPSSIISTGFSNIPEETTPLLRSRSRSRVRRRRGASVSSHGNATVTQAVLMVCMLRVTLS